MPFHRRFVKRQTKGKGTQRHAGTLVIASHGPGSTPDSFRIVETEGGNRTVDGSAQTFSASRSTDETCNVGDLIKFLNIFIQTGPRLDSNQIGQGWLEWVVKVGKGSDTLIPITNMGTETLGVVANRMFPGQCLMSGNFPVGRDQPNSVAISLKVPKKAQYLVMGDQIDVWIYFRTSNSTEMGTNNVRSWISYIYKAYQ